MYHLRLTKALSYSGDLTATRKHPDIYTGDMATANAAVASGYFTIIPTPAAAQEPEQEPEQPVGHLDRAQLEDMTLENLIGLAVDMGIDVNGEVEREALIDAIVAQEVIPGPAPDYEALAAMKKAELIAYAEENGIDIKSCKTKEDILATICVAYGGSYTMIDLQKQE